MRLLKANVIIPICSLHTPPPPNKGVAEVLSFFPFQLFQFAFIKLANFFFNSLAFSILIKQIQFIFRKLFQLTFLFSRAHSGVIKMEIPILQQFAFFVKYQDARSFLFSWKITFPNSYFYPELWILILNFLISLFPLFIVAVLQCFSLVCKDQVDI